MASRTIWKKTTGLTGIPVCENPQQVLRHLYAKLFRVLQKIPEKAAYRTYTEQIIRDRLAIVESEADPARLQEKLGMGQVEEVIIQAEHEVNLARHFVKWKAWEPLVEKAPVDQWRWPPH